MTTLMKLIEPLRKKINQMSELDIVRFPHHLGIDFNILQIIRKHGIDTIMDVGANEGQFALRMRDLGFNGMIHSFEPVKKTYAALAEKAARDPHWKAHNFALGKAAGRATINVYDTSQFSSFLQSSDFGRDRFGDMRLSGAEQVEVKTFDAFFRDAGVKSDRIFLKMDTQGFDLDVFAGASESLDNIVGLLSEVAFVPIYEGMPDYLTALDEYAQRGFRVSGFYPVTKRDDFAMIEADCVMVRDQAARAGA